jgi:hypothetical protein
LFAFFGAVLGFVAGLAAVGDDVDGFVVGEGVGDEPAGGLVEDESMMMPRMKKPEMAMPSGLSMMFAIRA